MAIVVAPEIEAKLNEAARKKGVDVSTLLSDLLEMAKPANGGSHVKKPSVLVPSYLRQRLEDEFTDDPDEIRKAEATLEEFKKAMNAERVRSGAEPIF